MIYILIAILGVAAIIAILIWFRKLQYDAIHQNFLDLVDHYGGKVIRGGFAIRPKYAGEYNNTKLSLSISSEKKKDQQSRRFYISLYLEAPSKINYTVMSANWLNIDSVDMSDRSIRKICGNKYVIEVSEKKMLERLPIAEIENMVEKLDPFAYVLVSKRGLILERISQNLIEDTKFEHLDKLIQDLHALSRALPKNG
jgi:hypothetical protein